ncbi:MAG TPA: S8 family serine peptidase [Gemmatimonadaceae bacterium]
MRFTLDDPPFAGRSGQGVIVAVLDSGVHADHPHVGRIIGGVSFAGDADDFVDRIGHGTAVTAAIHEKAPGAEVLAVKIFERHLATNADVLSRAIEWAADHGAHLINLSLGTANAAHAERLATAVDSAATRGALVVSALETNGTPLFPGSLAAVAGVVADWSCDRDSLDVTARAEGEPRFTASAYPRPIPGVPKERNLAGVSFAVANVTGFLARAIESGALPETLRGRPRR